MPRVLSTEDVLRRLERSDRTEATLKRIAIYPGSFDPPTNGHLDLIERGAKIFDELIVAILHNREKRGLFSVDDRRTMLQEMARHCPNVRVDTFDGLLVDYAVEQKAVAVLRGIRAISDYEYELQMALMNRKLQPKIETVFMMPAEAYSYLSSRLVKEIARLHGDVSTLVPPLVARRLREAVKDGRTRLQALEPPTEAHEIDSSVGSVTSEFKMRRGVRRRK